MNLWQEFKKGIFSENPVFRLVLGMCPVLAVTTAAINGIGMGLATTFVLLGSGIFISLLRKAVPENVRIPCYIVVIATFVTIVDYSMAAYFPVLHKSLGIFVPLIVVNCIILGRAEAFAGKHPLTASIVDAAGMGVGFTVALFIIGSIRELLGVGTILGLKVTAAGFQPAIMMIMPPGAFITIGCLLGFFNWIVSRRKVCE